MEEIIIKSFDYFGTFIFAITGAVRAMRCKLDMFGVIVLACLVGVGGGIMRDAIIGATPAMALTKQIYLVICIFSALVIFWFPYPQKLEKWHIVTYADAIGLGVFTAIGAAKGMQYELMPIGVVLTGVITAVGGGILRDIMVGRIPVVLQSDFYATASLIGGIAFYILSEMNLHSLPLFVITAMLVISLRIFGYHYKFKLPTAKTDFTD